LEDTGVTPLWDDATLNGFLNEAMRHYGARFPREASTTISVPAGATHIAVAGIEPDQIRRIFDAEGVLVPRQTGFDPPPSGGPASGQAWRWWNSTLILNHPAPGEGDWTIEHGSARSLPDDDTTEADIIPGDDDIVVHLAIAAALRRRAIEDGKRGLSRSGDMMPTLAAQADAHARQLIAARLRRVRGGWIASM
jgi:hypothetical protein